MKNGIVTDIDDTLINTDRRRWAAWCIVLDRKIDFQVVKSYSSMRILKEFGSGDMKLWEEFWKILLCWDNRGNEIMELNEPIPYASDVIQKWAKSFAIVYLTGRTSNMYDLTLSELAEFGFPIANIDLLMSPTLEDYLGHNEETRKNLLNSVSNKLNVVLTVDDNPHYFVIYSDFHIPKRIGFLRSERFERESYGNATRIISDWGELLDYNPLS